MHGDIVATKHNWIVTIATYPIFKLQFLISLDSLIATLTQLKSYTAMSDIWSTCVIIICHTPFTRSFVYIKDGMLFSINV